MKETVIARTIQGDKKEVLVKDLKFRIGVYAVIIREGKVLLTPWDDGWDFPGGGMDIDESINEALAREVREETGMEIEQGPLVVVGNNFFISPTSQRPSNSIGIYYLGLNAYGDSARTDFTESEKAHSGPPKWFDIEEAKKLKFYASSINAVEAVAVLEKAVKMLKEIL